MFKAPSFRLAFAFLVSFFLAMQLAVVHAEETLKSGSFKGLSNHMTTGDVSVVKTANGHAVVLQDSFLLDGAPDPKVGFGINGKYDTSTQLAHLKSNSGRQVYEIPASIDISKYNEVYIWCEAYSVPLGVASMK
jgi:hypothetical protein